MQSEIWDLSNKVRVARTAERQFGRITWAQLQAIGIPSSTVGNWVASGYLHPELPRVYAVGSRARTVESDLAAALLYAGPGAALSHATAAWWFGLLDHRPPTIQVTTSRQCRSLPGITVHGRRRRPRIMHRGLPITTVPDTLRDLAATATLTTLRRALASAEYQDLLDLREIQPRRGARGAATLRRALERHQPLFALTKSDLERVLVESARRTGLLSRRSTPGSPAGRSMRSGASTIWRSSSTATATTTRPPSAGETGARRWRSDRRG